MKTQAFRTRPRCAPALLVLVTALAPLPALGQDPARLQLNHLDKLAEKADQVVDVTLDGRMLQFASKFLEKDDPEEAAIKDLLKNLKGVYVKVFQFDKEGEYSPADVEMVRAQLRAPTWSRIVGVRSKREHGNAEVYLMGEEKNIQGLAIIAADPEQLTVVNIVGPIDLDKLSELGGHLGVPPIEVEKGDKSKKEVGTHEKKD